MDFSLSTYVQPVASHIQHPERLLVRDQNGVFHLWHGNGQAMIDISPDLASWIADQPELELLPTPRHWFDVATLPMAIEMYDNEWSVAD